MYLRGVHADATIATLRKLIRDNPLGILTTAIRSPITPFILSSHIPFVLDVEDEDSETGLGVLRGHLARANPQSKVMTDAAQSRSTSSPAEANVLEEEVLVLFNSTAQHYVTPKFYVETKPATGKVVPTWNYAAAQVYGRAKIYWDHKSDETIAFLSKQIKDLSDYAEEHVMDHVGIDDRPCPWKVSDAPESYVELLQKAIIGIEIKIDRLEGKFKMSQELPVGDRQGVIQGFSGLGTEVGCQMASLVKERGDLKDQRKGQP
jgi:transcriptional regulator